MKIAVEGCAHGELEKIYDSIANIEKQENCKIDLLICCGDFQATRNLNDLQTMAVPPKYLDMCTFYKYYSGEKIAPILTIFIGGNHEASNYLQELPYGGWVAPKIYYVGYAGVVKVNGIRIGGISGIYKGSDFFRGHHEFSPYSDSSRRSVYHVRQLEVFRLKQLTNDIDIFLSHDWPRGIYNYGNLGQLVHFKPYFKEEIDANKLGSPPCEDLLKCLKPAFWFSAHMHCKFAALVPHENSEKMTKFLALDKCLPKRRFLQILDIESEYTGDAEIKFEYDLEWLTILFLTNHLISVRNSPGYMPGASGTGRFNFTPTDEEKDHIHKKFSYDLRIPENFCRTVEPYNENEIKTNPEQPKSQINPQTTTFCDTLGIDDPLSLAMVLNGHELSHSSTLTDVESSENNESGEKSSLNSNFLQVSPLKRVSLNSILPQPKWTKQENIEEIDLDDDQDEKIIREEESEKESFNSIKDININKEEFKFESKPPIKKFKRRNHEIYSSNDY